MGEGLGGRDVPAVVVVGGAGEDGDEAILLRQGVVLGLLGISWPVTSAAVKLRQWLSALFLTLEAKTYREDNSWLGCELGRNIDVHLQPRRVRTKVRYLDQGAHYDGTEHRKDNEAAFGQRSLCHFDKELKG